MTPRRPGVEAWSDDPIASLEDDQLGRRSFAEQTAKLIEAGHSPDRSTVYGLIGPWGSGKSSLINMVEQSLTNSNGEWVVHRYTPWAASDADGITAEFFRTLAGLLPSDGSQRSNVKASLREYARLATPILKAIPFAGDAASEISERMLDYFTKDKSWQSKFEELAQELKSLKLSVLLVVDDIDRLHQDELLSLFKTVRLLGRFPGIDYLLAYDEESVLTVLTGSSLVSDETRALRYLEKIVQYPLMIPPVQAFHLDKIFQEGLEGIFGAALDSWPEDDAGRLEECYTNAFRERLTTVRAVNRYLAQLRQYLPLLPDSEVNRTDYILLSFLRLHYPKLYERLPRNKEKLLGEGIFDPFETTPNEERNQRVRTWIDSELLEVVPNESRINVLIVLRALFPALGESGYRGELEPIGSIRRVSESNYFERYFALGVPADDVPDSAVRSALESIAEGDSQRAAPWLKEILVMSLNTGSKKVLEKVRFQSPVGRSMLSMELLSFSFDVLAALDDGYVMFMQPRRLLLPWIAELCLQLPQAGEEVFSILSSSPLTLHEQMKVVRLLEIERPQIKQRGGTCLSTEDLEQLQEAAGRYAANMLLRRLESGELKRGPDDIGFLYNATLAFAPPEVRIEEKIWNLIDLGTIRLDELAAVWVSDEHAFDTTRLGRFNDSLFEQIAVVGGLVRVRDSTHSDNLDRDDTSWPNRVRFANEELQAWEQTETIVSTDQQV